MHLTLSIPALLFPAISLSMLAYNARYLAIAALIRQLHQRYQETESAAIGLQVKQLRKRLTIIKNMQAVAIMSFLLAVVTMFLIYVELDFWANLVFGVSLFALMISLILSFIEVQLSTKALSIQLEDIAPQSQNVVLITKYLLQLQIIKTLITFIIIHSHKGNNINLFNPNLFYDLFFSLNFSIVISKKNLKGLP